MNLLRVIGAPSVCALVLVCGCSGGREMERSPERASGTSARSAPGALGGDSISPIPPNTARPPVPSSETTAAIAPPKSPDAAVIQPGDQIQISVWGYPEFNSTPTVQETGNITLPLLGDVRAASLTRNQLEAELRQRLSQFIKGDINLTLAVIDLIHQRVSVMGAVNRQDNYPVMTDIPLVELLSQAGGTAPDADLRHVRIYRNSVMTNAQEVDLTRHMQEGELRTIPRLHPGDIVFVPREENLVRDLSGYARDVFLLFGFFRVLY